VEQSPTSRELGGEPVAVKDFVVNDFVVNDLAVKDLAVEDLGGNRVHGLPAASGSCEVSRVPDLRGFERVRESR